MKLRHAATLALVVWYLMAPPVVAKNDAWLQEDVFAPLSQWGKAGVFPTKDECDANRPVIFLCISADDPRLENSSVRESRR